jgi:hypothetical protein
MEVFIHIGYPKTGSTAIQSHVFTNRKWFMERGLYIPKAGYGGGFGHAHLLPTTFVPPIEFGEKAGPTELEKLVEELQQAEQNGFSKCLITWEGFTDKREAQLETFAAALKEHQVIVLAYVRDHADLYQSIILQDLEQLRFNRARALLEQADTLEQTEVFEQMGPKFDYFKFLGMWKEAFNPDVIIKTRLFDRSRLLENNVVIDFLQWLGLEVDEKFCLQTKSVNPSLDCRSGALLASAHAAGADSQALRVMADALIAVIGKEKAKSRQFLGEAERALIREFYSDSTRQLFNEFRPENALESETEFELVEKATPEADDQGTLEWLQSFYTAMKNPLVPLWQGNALTSMNLAKIANVPSRGWRGPEQLGIWTIGRQSELRFRIPQVHSTEGPRAISVVIAGHYYGENTTTRVSVAGREQTVDLTHFTLRIEIDARVQENGICIVLDHAYPTIAEEGNSDPELEGIAFKLQFLLYEFIWE